jgi:UDP-N-acetylmuramoyl-L-alanyl-D-glutamate--2,6-diaminopimelate ligase
MKQTHAIITKEISQENRRTNMFLGELLKGIQHRFLSGDLHTEVDQITYDSRVKMQNGMFVAIEGFKLDGHLFIEKAIENGAKVIVVQKEIPYKGEGITIVCVEDTRKAMATLANHFYDNPSHKLDLVGVTGTNGKTSITYLLAEVLENQNYKTGLIGTIENRIGKEVLKSEHTTPESIDLQALFSKMAQRGVTHTLMEVSSHALQLHRVNESLFKIGIFTNLTQDHLDFHKTMEAYAKAKAKLFTMCEIGIVNIDSAYAQNILEESTCQIVTYGIDNKADYTAKDIHITASKTTYTLETSEGNFAVSIPIPGTFTVYNSLAVIAAARNLGVSMQSILDTLQEAKGVPGRVQSFESAKGYSAIVDYAHTPDGLENVLSAIRQFAKGDVITVFGCGGDRDKTKRPLMGKVAAMYSDQIIITSDNPRSEQPEAILDQIEEGIKPTGKKYIKMVDRKEAIVYALSHAKAEDVVLIAGKGHEDYQILKDRIIHFDDSEIVRTFIQEENQ